MDTSATDDLPGARLYLGLWVNVKSKQKARLLARRIIERADIPPDSLDAEIFDEDRQLQKLAGSCALPVRPAAGVWTAPTDSRTTGEAGKPLATTALYDDHWAIDGYAAEKELSHPGLIFLTFSARSIRPDVPLAMNHIQIAEDLRNVLEQVDGLPADDVENITVLIRVGEWKIALETLCTQIYEYDLEPKVSVREELIRLGRGLQTPVAYL